MVTNTAQTNNDGNDIGKPTEAYNFMAERTLLSRTLMEGQDGMFEAGTRFLPRYAKETIADYNARLTGTSLTNVYRKTVINLANKPLTEEPVFPEDTDTRIMEWVSNDINREGENLSVFSKELIKDALVTGKTHILAEYPKMNEGEVITLTDVKEKGLRPYLVHVKSENLIGWKSEIQDGVRVLTQIRIKEISYKDKGKYGQEMVETIRLLEPGHFELWTKDSDTKQWTMEEEGDTSLDYIPLSTVYFTRRDFMVASPTLGDLAHLNQHHWLSTSSQNHALVISRIPVLFGKMLGGGVDPSTGEKVEVTVSPNALVLGNNKDSELSFVEHSGKALEAGRADLDSTLETMEAFSMQLLIPRTGDQSATEKAIDTAAANSDLQSMIESLEAAMLDALQNMAKLDGSIDADAIEKPSYFKQFNLKTGSVEEMTLMLDSANAGKLSEETYLVEMDRRGFFYEGFTVESELERIANQPTILSGDPLAIDDEDDDTDDDTNEDTDVTTDE